MIKILKRMYSLAGDKKNTMIATMLFQFLDNTLSFTPIGVVLYVFYTLLHSTLTVSTACISLAIMVLGVVLRSIVRFVMEKKSYSITLNVFYNEKYRIADYLKRVNMGFYTDDNIGKVSNTLINGMIFLEEKFLHTLLDFIASFANIVIAGVFLLVINPVLALIYIVTVLVVFLLLIPYQKAFTVHSNKSNIVNEKLASAIIEYVKNISVIKAFHLVGKHTRSNSAFSQRLDNDLDAEKINIPYLLGTMLVMSLSTAGMIYFVMSQYEVYPVYIIITLSIMAIYMYGSLLSVSLSIGGICSAQDVFDKIDELYAQKTIVCEGDEKPNGYSIEFSDVEFAYEKKNVIDGISFTLKENTLNALVGLSGSGKSTLVNLIPRFFDIQKGEIKIGGVNIKNMSEETLNSSISMVFQNVYLFNDTIYNNIAFGNTHASKEDIFAAAKKAKCYDFIMALPNGFDTMVGEAGLSLSGGERQRISIARAILKDAPIILLDEATASIDADNERDIQLAINELVKDKTILVIAHKLSCVKNADKILVLDKGTLVAQGTHSELIKEAGLYKTLCQKRAQSKAWVIEN